MLYSTASQALEFPLLMLTGMLMAAVSLAFHTVRRLLCAGLCLSLICDIMMGILWALIYCAGIIAATGGQSRTYHILSAALGAGIFHGAMALPLRKSAALLHLLLCSCRKTVSKNRFFRAIFK